MRLKNEEISAIKTLAQKHFGKNAKVYIFGSRTDDTKSGGDIDIYMEISTKRNVFMKKIGYLVELKKKIGERKIDLIINNRTTNRHIFDIAKSEGTRI